MKNRPDTGRDSAIFEEISKGIKEMPYRILERANEALETGQPFSEGFEKLAKSRFRQFAEDMYKPEGEVEANENIELFFKLYTHPYFEKVDELNAAMGFMLLKTDWGLWGERPPTKLQDHTDRWNHLFYKILDHYGLDSKKVLKYWQLSIDPMPTMGKNNMKDSEQQAYIIRNMDTLRSIERQRPGIAKVLMDEFGVVNFGKFSEELLVKQYDEREDKTGNYGIVGYGVRDYNGATYQGRHYQKELLELLPQDWKVRATECTGKFGIGRSLIKLDRKYGDKQKPSFAIIGAHGNDQAISFGDWEVKPQASITLDDIQKGKGLERLSEFFSSGAVFLIDSCQVGKRGGVGQEIFKSSGIRVIAFNGDTRGMELKGVNFDDGNIDFDVRFRGEDGKMKRPTKHK